MAKKLFILAALAALFLTLPVAALAKFEPEQSVYVAKDEIVDGNLIRVGNIIDINGAVNGDVIVAGNSITIAGPVAGDVIAAGNVIRINGPVAGSVRVVGSSVEINAPVEHNVWVGAGSVALGSEASVGWDVYAGAGSLEIKGPVDGNVWAGTGSLVISGIVGKDVLAAVDKEGQLILNPEAAIGGNLTYQAQTDEQLIQREGATVTGEIKRTDWPVGETRKGTAAGWVFGKIFSYFSLLVIGLVLVSLVPKFLLQLEQEMVKRPGPAIGWGIIYFFLTPIAILFLLITVIGAPLALILVPVYLIALYLSKVIVGFTVGQWVIRRLSGGYKGSLIWPLALGLLLVVVVGAVPVAGWLICLVAIWWALGAVVAVKKEIIKEYR